MKNIFIENGRILEKFAKGAEVSVSLLDGIFWRPVDFKKS